MILGVCTWLSSKFGISAGIIRIAFVIAVLFFGTGILFYFIAWILKMITK